MAEAKGKIPDQVGTLSGIPSLGVRVTIGRSGHLTSAQALNVGCGDVGYGHRKTVRVVCG